MSRKITAEEHDKRVRARIEANRQPVPSYVGARLPHPLRGQPSSRGQSRGGGQQHSSYPNYRPTFADSNRRLDRYGTGMRPDPIGRPSTSGTRDWSLPMRPIPTPIRQPEESVRPRDGSVDSQSIGGPSFPPTPPMSPTSGSSPQTEPSVRPKVRRIPNLNEMGSERVDYIPTPGIVQRYRNPVTREPDFEAMRRSTPDLPEHPSSASIAQRSHQRMAEIKDTERHKANRQKKTLESMGMRPGMAISDRYKRSPQDRPQMMSTDRMPRLMPSPTFKDDKYNRRVNRPQRDRELTQRFDRMPLGRQMKSSPHWNPGRLDVKGRQEFANKYPDSGPRDRNFFTLHRNMNKEKRAQYDNYRDHIDPNSELNKSYRESGRFKPRRSPGAQFNRNKDRMNQIRSRMASLRGMGDRQERSASNAQQRLQMAKLESHAVPEKFQDLPPIPEEDEEQDEDEGEEEEKREAFRG